MRGSLYIVATPIGNLEDLTFRAKRTLEEVDLIACEDTRHSSILLNHYGISKPMLSFHSHSPEKRLDTLVSELSSGKNVALISDAGTPGISDPGYVLIQGALQAGITVIPIPGPSATVTALSASGLPTDKFVYLGFLPLKKGRQTLLKELATLPYTFIFYESPFRLIRTIGDLQKYLPPESKISIAKELTKMYETYFRGTLADILKKLPPGNPKGEYVVMVHPN